MPDSRAVEAAIKALCDVYGSGRSELDEPAVLAALAAYEAALATSTAQEGEAALREALSELAEMALDVLETERESLGIFRSVVQQAARIGLVPLVHARSLLADEEPENEIESEGERERRCARDA